MAEEQSAPSKPKDFKKLFGFVFFGLNILALGFGAYLVFISTLGVKPKTINDQQAREELEKFEASLRGQPVVYTMDPFNTNLDGVPRRLIRMKMSLEMLDEEGFEEVVSLGPQARDSIVRILNGKSFTDVESVQGKLHLKNQIITELNAFLDKGVVKNVYFSDFVVQ